MMEAGLTPLEAITCATRNGARLLKIDKDYGTLTVGKKADFMILDGDPLADIKATRKIISVWQDGVKVSDGPLN